MTPPPMTFIVKSWERGEDYINKLLSGCDPDEFTVMRSEHSADVVGEDGFVVMRVIVRGNDDNPKH
jgi:hypothetical protein